MTKPGITTAAIEDFLQTRYPRHSIEALSEGMESRAVRFVLGNMPCVLRINRDDAGFKKDRLAHSRFGSTIPIPQVLDIGVFDEQHSYCISAFIRGKTLQDLSEREIDDYLEPTYQILLRIRNQDTTDIKGVGKFDEKLQANFSSWHSYLRSFADGAYLRWGKVGFDLKRIIFITDEYNRLIDHCPERRDLVHGDFGSNNVIVDEGAVVAVLDWDCAAVGDYLADVATAYFWSHHLNCMKRQAEYFELKLAASEKHYRERILCYQLKIALEEIHEALVDESLHEVGLFIDRAKAILG